MNKRLISAFFVTGLLVGLMVTWQLYAKVPVNGTFAGDELEARETLFADYLNEQAYLQDRIVNLRNSVQEAEQLVDAQSESANLELLNRLKRDIGLTEVKGSGVIVTLEDGVLADRAEGDLADSKLVQASDLRDIVNLLNAAKAEAIAINGQRVIAVSPIASVGTTILVNNTYITPPFVISAVGDREIILQRLFTESLLPSLYARSKASEVRFKIETNESISVPIYNGNLQQDHINLVN